MEENLQSFIDSNKDLGQIEQANLQPAARFIHSQIYGIICKLIFNSFI